MTRPAPAESWPDLPYGPWDGTRQTLHRLLQMIGKVRMALGPSRNHWWHVPLYVDARGLTTGPMPVDGHLVQIRLDVLDMCVVAESSTGQTASFGLGTASVAELHARLLSCLGEVGCTPTIVPIPYELEDRTPFPADTRPRPWDPDAVTRYWQVLAGLQPVFQEFAGWSVAKTSPVHLFWHSMDLAFTRFSGRPASHQAATANRVAAEAYSHEVISFGFWAGDPATPYPALYSYTWPEPPSLRDQSLVPAQASWTPRGEGALAILAYDVVRRSASPRETVLAFLQSAYLAGARTAGWDVAGLARTQQDLIGARPP